MKIFSNFCIKNKYIIFAPRINNLLFKKERNIEVVKNINFRTSSIITYAISYFTKKLKILILLFKNYNYNYNFELLDKSKNKRLFSIGGLFCTQEALNTFGNKFMAFLEIN